MTSPRRIVSTQFPTRMLGAAVAALQRQWHAAPLADEPSTLTGVVVGVRLGPLQDGELTLDIDGDHWTIEVGHPWRSERAGLHADMVAKGRCVRVIGRRHADPARRCLHAEQLVIDDRVFDLQPGHA